jgi:hypothetical protein
MWADTEENALFEFGDRLHATHEHGTSGMKLFWVGFLPKGAFQKDPHDNEVVAVILITDVPDGPRFGWMPRDQPYWHRADFCPLLK